MTGPQADVLAELHTAGVAALERLRREFRRDLWRPDGEAWPETTRLAAALERAAGVLGEREPA